MYFDIVLVYYHQQEKRTPSRDQQKDNNRGDGGGQAMQLALHDLTDQSWVLHVGPPFLFFSFFLFWGGERYRDNATSQ